MNENFLPKPKNRPTAFAFDPVTVQGGVVVPERQHEHGFYHVKCRNLKANRVRSSRPGAQQWRSAGNLNPHHVALFGDDGPLTPGI